MASEAESLASAGQVLAGRYRLERLLTGTGRPARLWRGEDIVLQRAVAVKIIPSNDPGAEALLSAALSSGRVTEHGLVRVFDAAEQGGYTYVVSEWLAGQPLHRLLLNEEVLPATRASFLVAAAADTVAAAHAVGMTHGNLHPANMLVSGEGDVRLTDLRDRGEQADDVRGLGALLYASLTGRWPGPGSADGLPDAPTYTGGTASPRQVRAGVPTGLSELTGRALQGDPTVTAAGFARDVRRFSEDPSTTRLPVLVDRDRVDTGRWRRVGLVAAAIVLIAVIGLVVGVNTGVIRPLGGLNYPSFSARTSSSPTPSPGGTITPRSARILDPDGDGTELSGAGAAIDGKASTGWQTQDYTTADFGRLKPGMGVLVDLGTPVQVGSVTVDLGTGGARLQLRAGDSSAPRASGFALLATSSGGASRVTLVPRAGAPAARYWLVWATRLPRDANGAYSLDVREITFHR